MISVIIPLYNKEKTIKKTIESILSQTYRDLEVIVVDDGSTDGSPSVIPHLMRDPATKGRIKFFTENKNYGANWARNYGARKANGEYLFFCDADVILRNNAIEVLKKALDDEKTRPVLVRSDKDGSCCDIAYSYSAFTLGWKKFASQPFDKDALKKFNYISTMSLLRKKDFSGFDENIEKFQDWDLWLTMLERGKIGVFAPEVLFYAQPSRHGKSKWFPSFFYKIPWKKFGIKIKALEEYESALRRIKEKHNI